MVLNSYRTLVVLLMSRTKPGHFEYSTYGHWLRLNRFVITAVVSNLIIPQPLEPLKPVLIGVDNVLRILINILMWSLFTSERLGVITAVIGMGWVGVLGARGLCGDSSGVSVGLALLFQYLGGRRQHKLHGQPDPCWGLLSSIILWPHHILACFMSLDRFFQFLRNFLRHLFHVSWNPHVLFTFDHQVDVECGGRDEDRLSAPPHLLV